MPVYFSKRQIDHRAAAGAAGAQAGPVVGVEPGPAGLDADLGLSTWTQASYRQLVAPVQFFQQESDSQTAAARFEAG